MDRCIWVFVSFNEKQTELQIGAARLVEEVMQVMQRLPTMVNEMTGVDLNRAISGKRS